MGRRGNIVLGALVGYVASRTMDQATTWFYLQQSDESKRREEEIAPGGSLRQFGKEVGKALGKELADADADRVGLAFHRTMGVAYGIATAALVERGAAAMPAGLGVGAAAFVIVDEGTAISDFSDYPVESHLRGVVGHAAFGLVAGALMSLAQER